MTRYALSSSEVLVLRDGRPFGEVGTFGGTSLPWPLPQTIAGMCRTAVGFSRATAYFDRKEHCEAVLSLGLEKIVAVLVTGSGRKPLLPTPADLVFTAETAPMAHCLDYAPVREGEGTDLDAPHWLYPTIHFQGKPAPAPLFVHSELARQYLLGEISPQGVPVHHAAQTVGGPVRDFRIHTAIDPRSFSVDEGRLYAESGIYLTAQAIGDIGFENTGDPGHLGELEIEFHVTGLEPEEKLSSSLYLGGERRRVDLAPVEKEVCFQPPDSLDHQEFLKLVLTTHGDFGGWVPGWLLPQGHISTGSWVEEPTTSIQVRLRSAVVMGWDPLSGWDQAVKKPKAFRKLVKPGSVYLIELKDPARSGELARALWGSSLCSSESQAHRDGFGQMIVAKNHVHSSGKEQAS